MRDCETARQAFFFASPRHFNFLDCETETPNRLQLTNKEASTVLCSVVKHLRPCYTKQFLLQLATQRSPIYIMNAIQIFEYFGFVKATQFTAEFRDSSEFSDCVHNVWAKICLPCQILYVTQNFFLQSAEKHRYEFSYSVTQYLKVAVFSAVFKVA